jgi:hypothetical protein
VDKFAYTSSSRGTRRITRQVQPNSPGKTRRITLIPVFCSVATHTPILGRGIAADRGLIAHVDCLDALRREDDAKDEARARFG